MHARTRDLLTPLWTAQQPPALSPQQWEALLAQARATRLTARLALHFQDKGWRSCVPPACWQHLASALRVTERLRSEVVWEADHVVDALRALPTPVVLLKGAAYVLAGLPPGRARLFSDVDILVSRETLRDVEMALFARGWMPEKLKPYDDRYYRQWMHELPPLQHVQRRTFLDVHHTVTPPTSRFPIDGSALLQCAQPLAGEPRLSVLAPADMVLHSAVHLMQDGDFSAGLRDLLDINDLLSQFAQAPEFWPSLLTRAGELRLAEPLSHVLTQLQRLFSRARPACTRWRCCRALSRRRRCTNEDVQGAEPCFDAAARQLRLAGGSVVPLAAVRALTLAANAVVSNCAASASENLVPGDRSLSSTHKQCAVTQIKA